jgi:hypothetical protein
MPIDAVSNSPSIVMPDNKVLGAWSTALAEKKSAKTSDEDSQEIMQLAERDRHVRAHEAAHMAAGGQYVRGGATFQYQKGPDGKMYAVGGEVSIDASPVKGDPQATISKMQVVKGAALAPGDPSGQDRSVAAAASAAEAQARQELAKKAMTGNENGNEPAVIGSSNKKESNSKEPVKTSSYNKKGEAIAFPKNDQISLINLVSIS